MWGKQNKEALFSWGQEGMQAFGEAPSKETSHVWAQPTHLQGSVSLGHPNNFKDSWKAAHVLAWRTTQPVSLGPCRHLPHFQESPWVLVFQSCSGFQVCEQTLPGHFWRWFSIKLCTHVLTANSAFHHRLSGPSNTKAERALQQWPGIYHSQELPIAQGITPRANYQLSRNWTQASKHTHKSI